MKKSYSIFLSTLFCFLFCSLSAQDAQLNAASRKVIIEAPAEPGTHLEVAYRPAGSFFPSYVQSGQQVDVGTTLIIDAYSDNPTKLPLVAVRVNGGRDRKIGIGIYVCYTRRRRGYCDFCGIRSSLPSRFLLFLERAHRTLCGGFGRTVDDGNSCERECGDNGESYSGQRMRFAFSRRER